MPKLPAVKPREDEVLLYYKFYDDIYTGKYILIATKKGFRSLKKRNKLYELYNAINGFN